MNFYNNLLFTSCFGAGGTKGKHGVVFLLHKRWKRSVRRFHRNYERLASLELHAGLRRWSNQAYIVFYMPHCGYEDLVLEEIYENISNIVAEARGKGRIIVLAGDWNAEGESKGFDSEAPSSVGHFGNKVGNAKVLWFSHWAESQKPLITNTVFKKLWGPIWTYLQHDRQRQLVISA